MAFCTECGYKLPDNAIFCPNCGKRINSPHICSNYGESENNPDGIIKEDFSFGYPPTLDMKPKTKGKKIMTIVISAAVIILIIAVIIVSHALKNENPFVGYWESSAIDNGSGEMSNTYLGEKVEGLFGIQINSDGTALIASAYNPQIYKATWVDIVGGIEVSDDNDDYDLTIINGRLFLKNDGQDVIFEKSGKDIYHPTITHGSLSASKDGSLDEQYDTQVYSSN